MKINFNTVTTEKVIDLYLADLLNADFTVDKLIDSGESSEITACTLTYLDDLMPVLRFCTGHCNDYFFNAHLFYKTGDVISVSADLNTMNT